MTAFRASTGWFSRVQSCNKQLTRTDDPSGRDVNMNMYEHLKWLAAAAQELIEKVDKLLKNE